MAALLETIRRIIQAVNAAESFNDALQIMVRSIRNTIKADACTVLLVDEASSEFVLMATDGLNPESVGNIRLGLQEGLVGLIGQREEPLNIENAAAHPQFAHIPDVGEESFYAFLGVPIIHQRQLLGVLMVQHYQQRRFDEAEEAFMVTLSAQLSGIIAHAKATGAFNALLHHASLISMSLKGIATAPGVNIAKAMVFSPHADLDTVPDRYVEDIASEIALFEQALQATRDDLQDLSERLSGSLSVAERSLFDAYSRILDSEDLGAEVLAYIQQGQWAQGALRRVIKQYVRQFERLEDDYLRERASDIEDLGIRILSYLQATQPTVRNYAEPIIAVGEVLTPAVLTDIPAGKIAGIICAKGSSNSHLAIVARGLGIPAVMGVQGLPLHIIHGRETIIDGYNGQVHISPVAQLKEAFACLLEQQRQVDKRLSALRYFPAQTLDAVNIPLYANVGLAADTQLALQVGAEGVGLYRSEVTFMVQDCFPSEEEQFLAYRHILSSFAPRPVTMRLLDIGGDKTLPYFPISEDNPYLGWRGIRVTLDHPELFLVQARAMLRANIDFQNLQLLLPMVSQVAEITEAKRLLNQAQQELIAEGLSATLPAIGVMVEVPALIYQIHAIAKHIDFFSVGSNDLTQYLLAVDRNNNQVATLYDSLHPAVLAALQQIVINVHQAGKKVSICGEMASDPTAILLLLGLGFDSFSMAASSIPRIKWVIRNFSLQQAKKLLSDVLSYDKVELIRQHIQKFLIEADLADALGIFNPMAK